MGIAVPARLGLTGDSLLPIVRDVDIGWYNPGTGRGIAMTTIDGSVSIRAHVPGKGDYRYTRYPDGTEELYDISRDPNEHVNRVNFDTGKGKTTADDAMRTLMSGLMDGQLAQQGYLISDGTRALTGTAADEMLVTTVGPGINSLAGRGGDDTYLLYRNATITEAAGGGNDLVVIRNEALESSFVLPLQVETVKVNRNFTGNDAANRIIGGGPGNVLNGAGGNDTLLGLSGNDTLSGRHRQRRAARLVRPGSPYGRARERHARRRRRLRRLRLHRRRSDSAPTAPDVILAFDGRGAAAGDKIDLSAIDANGQLAGNQAFGFGGTTIGRVRLVEQRPATPRCSPTPTRTPPPRCGSWCGTARRRPPPTPRRTSRCETSDSASRASAPRGRRARR